MSSIAMPFSGAGPLLLFLAKATVLLVAALVATMSLRRGTAGSRHLVWLAALVGVLALPLLSRISTLRIGLLPSSLGTPAAAPATTVAARPAIAVWAMPVPARVAPVAVAGRSAPVPAVAPVPPTPAPRRAYATVAAASARPAIPPRAVAPTTLPPTPTASPAPLVFAAPGIAGLPAADSTYSLLSIVAVVWGSVAIALLGWLVAGAMSVRRIVATARELTSPDWAMPLCEVADRLDLELPPRLVLSDRIEMAFACRAFSPTVVLPAAAESWSDDRRRAVLFHELAHVKRHDLLGHTLGRVACALYWFHPLVWTAAKHLRAESERACDDLVLRCGARPSEYAQHLLDMVTSVRNHGAPIMALPMARPKEFEGRMLAILDPAILRTAPGRVQTASIIALLGLLSVTVAAVAPASAASAPAVAMEPPASGVAAPSAVLYLPTPRPVAVGASAQPASPPTAAPSPSATRYAEAAPADAPQSLRGDANRAIATLANVFARQAVNAVTSVLGVSGAQGLAVPANDTARAALLIRILETDADADVRRTAAWGLNEMETTETRAALIKAVRNDADADVREMAAWAIGEQGGSSAASAALADALTRDKSAHVRSTAAWALGEIGDEGQVAALAKGAADPELDVRHTSIWAIGQVGVTAAPRAVVAALSDTSKDIRLVAAWALGEIEDKSAASAVVKAFQTETDKTVRSAEMRALAAMDATTPEVVEMALKSTDPAMRKEAVSMLAGHGARNWPWPWPWPRPRPSP